MKTDPNPVGCRVVFFNDQHWIGFAARRSGSEFRFVQHHMGHGGWPTGNPGPHNARVNSEGHLVYGP